MIRSIECLYQEKKSDMTNTYIEAKKVISDHIIRVFILDIITMRINNLVTYSTQDVT